MDKIYPAARAIAILFAIAAAFAVLPQAALVLLVLGGISGFGSKPEDSQRILLTALALNVSAPLLENIPSIGSQLAVIFGGFGTAYAGAALVSITVALVGRVRSDWA